MDEDERKMKLFQIKNDYLAMEKRVKALDSIAVLIELLVGKKRLAAAMFKFPVW